MGKARAILRYKLCKKTLQCVKHKILLTFTDYLYRIDSDTIADIWLAFWTSITNKYNPFTFGFISW